MNQSNEPLLYRKGAKQRSIRVVCLVGICRPCEEPRAVRVDPRFNVQRADGQQGQSLQTSSTAL